MTPTPDKSVLRECPFCNGPAVLHHDSGNEVYPQSWSAGCNACNIRTPAIFGSSTWRVVKKEDKAAQATVIAAWNRRTPSASGPKPDLASLNRRAEELLKLQEAATPGPWKWVDGCCGLGGPFSDDWGSTSVLRYEPYEGMWLCPENEAENAAFIAAAHEMADLIRAYRAALDGKEGGE